MVSPANKPLPFSATLPSSKPIVTRAEWIAGRSGSDLNPEMLAGTTVAESFSPAHSRMEKPATTAEWALVEQICGVFHLDSAAISKNFTWEIQLVADEIGTGGKNAGVDLSPALIENMRTVLLKDRTTKAGLEGLAGELRNSRSQPGTGAEGLERGFGEVLRQARPVVLETWGLAAAQSSLKPIAVEMVEREFFQRVNGPTMPENAGRLLVADYGLNKANLLARFLTDTDEKSTKLGGGEGVILEAVSENPVFDGTRIRVRILPKQAPTALKS